MKRIFLFTLAVAFVMAGPAFAQAVSDTSVTVPYGQVAGDIALAGLTAIAGAVTFAFRFLPDQIQWVMKVARADQLMEKALAAARAQVAAKIEPLSITFDVKNKIVADALRYAIAHYPKLVDQLGGAELVRQKLQARLQEWIEKAAK